MPGYGLLEALVVVLAVRHAGHAGNRNNIALAAHLVDHVLGAVIAERDAIDLHDIGAGFGHTIDHGHDHALVARVPDDPVERRRRDREGHDGIRTGRDHRVHLLNLLLRVGARGLDPELHPIAVLRRPGHGDDGVLRFRLPRVADIAHAVIDEVLSVLGLCLGLVGSHAGGERYAHADGHRPADEAFRCPDPHVSPSPYVWGL